jgi:hypothetical protein
VTSDGATWLDRQLVSRDRGALADAGFGAEVRSALERRKDELIRQGHAWRAPDGSLRARKDLLSVLERQEVERVGQRLAAERGLAFKAVDDGQTICGKLIGSAQLASGRFAMVDDGLGFSLVPWRPVIEKEIGREVIGIMRGRDVSWQLGRKLGFGNLSGRFNVCGFRVTNSKPQQVDLRATHRELNGSDGEPHPI